MDFHLRVIEPFAARAIGEEIADPAVIGTVLAGNHRHKVVRVYAPAAAEEPEASGEPAETANPPADPSSRAKVKRGADTPASNDEPPDAGAAPDVKLP